jgi:hypothetical protein
LIETLWSAYKEPLLTSAQKASSKLQIPETSYLSESKGRQNL